MSVVLEVCIRKPGGGVLIVSTAMVRSIAIIELPIPIVPLLVL